VKGLVIQNPWLWCTTQVAADDQAKAVENRTWTTPHRGDVALIEGRRLDAGAWDGSHAPLIRAARQRWWKTQPLGPQVGPWPWETTRGAVVAVARLADVCGTCADRAQTVCCSPWAVSVTGHYHWRWQDMRPLPEPIPLRGWQGLRDLPADVEAAVREQLARPAEHLGRVLPFRAR